MEFAYLSDAYWTAPADRSPLQRFLDWVWVFDPRYIIREETEAEDIPDEKKEEKIKGFVRAESTYRRIKHSLTNEGDYEMAGEFYIQEMRMKRKRYWHSATLRDRWKFFWNLFYSFTSGYGERPKRLVVNALLIIFIFSLLYYASGGIAKGGDEGYDPDFRECLYFSVVTFTTLGYGDYSPKSAFQLVAVSGAFLGAFTMALFVLVFGRKVMR